MSHPIQLDPDFIECLNAAQFGHVGWESKEEFLDFLLRVQYWWSVPSIDGAIIQDGPKGPLRIADP